MRFKKGDIINSGDITFLITETFPDKGKYQVEFYPNSSGDRYGLTEISALIFTSIREKRHRILGELLDI